MEKFFLNEVNEMHTLQDLFRWTISKFNSTQIYYGHGTDNSWDEAIYLIFSSLYLPLNFPIEMYRAHLTFNERKQIIDRVMRRINERIPVAYLTNKAWFCDLEFYINEWVFIPRSPLGELISDNFRDFIPCQPKYILDMCTGSGCIAISSAYLYPETKIDAVDISIEALKITEINIQKHGLINRIRPILSDMFTRLPLFNYDLIITNPPYVDEEEMQNLPKEFNYEPILSLAAGKNGLTLVCRILACASDYLSENGILICEVGSSMVHLKNLYPQIPFFWITIRKGGDGIFMLTRKQLVDYRKFFEKYREICTN